MTTDSAPANLLRRAIGMAPVIPRRISLASTPEVAALHGLSSRCALENATAWEAFVTLAVDRLLWPFLVLGQLRSLPTDIFDVAARQAKRSRLGHFLATWWYCARYGISPSDYHRHALHQFERRRFAGDFLFQSEYQRIYTKMFRRSDMSEIQLTDDKLEFCRLCAQSGLQSPHVLGLAVNGVFEFLEPRCISAWDCDIIMKPRHGSNGSGFYRWQFAGDDRYVGALGENVSLDEILDQVLIVSASRPIVVQRRLSNDSQSAPLTSGALATVRVVTGRRANGDIELIAAAFKMPVGPSLVDNYMRGNVLTHIDVATGTMLKGTYYYHHLTAIDCHPDTGEQFFGKRVSQWNRIVKLAQSAHALVPSLAIVAFDIAPTTDGPVIVEANSRGDLSMVQYPGGCPIGQTAYARVVLEKFGIRTPQPR